MFDTENIMPKYMVYTSETVGIPKLFVLVLVIPDTIKWFKSQTTEKKIEGLYQPVYMTLWGGNVDNHWLDSV